VLRQEAVLLLTANGSSKFTGRIEIVQQEVSQSCEEAGYRQGIGRLEPTRVDRLLEMKLYMPTSAVCFGKRPSFSSRRMDQCRMGVQIAKEKVLMFSLGKHPTIRLHSTTIRHRERLRPAGHVQRWISDIRDCVGIQIDLSVTPSSIAAPAPPLSVLTWNRSKSMTANSQILRKTCWNVTGGRNEARSTTTGGDPTRDGGDSGADKYALKEGPRWRGLLCTSGAVEGDEGRLPMPTKYSGSCFEKAFQVGRFQAHMSS
jgi:hypothetical protein